MLAHPTLVRPCLANVIDAQIALWITRLSISFTAGIHEVDNGTYSEELRQMIGITPRDGRLYKAELRLLLKARVEELEPHLPRRTTVLQRNISLLGEQMGLDALQEEILAFVALSQQHQILSDVMDNIHANGIDGIIQQFSAALAVRETDVRVAVRPDGPLLGTRILSMKPTGYGRSVQLEVPYGLNAALFSKAKNIDMLMSAFVELAPRPHLTADAFGHLSDETELLTAYLSKAGSRGLPGINILIYGPPGTGKTQYALWLAARLRKSLFQVKATDAEGKPISGNDRLAFFLISQRFLENRDALVLFDEIEDVFPQRESLFSFFNDADTAPGKMFINHTLESNPVPAFWICNEVDHIDKAVRRRFDFSFEMGIPPTSVRRRILINHLDGHRISEGAISFLAQQEELSPAQIEKAAKVLKLTGGSQQQREDTLLFVVENSMSLLAQEQNNTALNLAECSYSLSYLNPDCDLKQLVTQLKRSPDAVGALCLYGAPGTGKTALAHYLAREIDLPMLVRRASDILGSYVGETEQNIAQMFKQARQEGALLLLDEADSFLTERKSARNSWEISSANEMLTQMESFDGLFICSTNLMQRLDEASLRRFTLKIKFDYMKPEQRWRLFLEQAKKLRRSREAQYRAVLDQLSNLTPGDFATVRRQAKMLSITLDADELLQKLTQECKNKRDSGSRPIGFIHAP